MQNQKWLELAIAQLKKAGILTARLDAQLLLCAELQQSRAWLLAHPEQNLTKQNVKNLRAQLHRRLEREPLAYLLGRQEFYTRNFTVTPAVLIPRPETEAMIEQLLALPLQSGMKLLEVGTGSGALAITAKLERPELSVLAVDISEGALTIAQQNAVQLGAEVNFMQQDLLNGSSSPIGIIVANLPYVDHAWQRSPETNFEPALALFADDEGQALIKKLILQATLLQHKKDYLLLESDPRQHKAIEEFAASYRYLLVKTQGFCQVFQKI